jgi:hypothetical protein
LAGAVRLTLFQSAEISTVFNTVIQIVHAAEPSAGKTILSIDWEMPNSLTFVTGHGRASKEAGRTLHELTSTTSKSAGCVVVHVALSVSDSCVGSFAEKVA